MRAIRKVDERPDLENSTSVFFYPFADSCSLMPLLYVLVSSLLRLFLVLNAAACTTDPVPVKGVLVRAVLAFIDKQRPDPSVWLDGACEHGSPIRGDLVL